MKNRFAKSGPGDLAYGGGLCRSGPPDLTNSAPSGELWTCLRLRAPALAALRRRLDKPPEPFAVTDGPANRPAILACSAQAAAAGVRPGQTLAAARALCPALVALPRDPEAERAQRDLLGAWAYGYSDQVSLDLPDAVTLETGGSLKLFRGWPRLEQQLRGDLRRLELDISLAVAPWPRAAWALAGHRDGLAIQREDAVRRALDALPIVEAGFDQQANAALRAMGFLRLRELAALPRESLGRRVGAAVPAQLDRLYGRAADPLPHWRPPDSFEAVIEFDARPTAVEPLLFALRRLLNDLAAVLQARDGGVQRFKLILLHEDAPATAVPIGLLRPERDPVRLLELTRARLERASLPAPVAGLALLADELPPFRPVEADLFATARQDATDWPLLLERLRARLGDRAVQVPVERDDHRPERAGDLVPVSDAQNPGRLRRPPAKRPDRSGGTGVPPYGAGLSPPDDVGRHSRAADLQASGQRPVWLLPNPIPLRPAPARILSGPERLESGWWDGGDLRRDYYIVETVQGQRAWAYCPPGRHDGWMLHGWFA